MHKFEEIIYESFLNIKEVYFKQATIITDKLKYNERVFCYEFYHQLRLNSEKFEGLLVTGEAVKSKFQFVNLSTNTTPDILIHSFGTKGNNEVVIEVKTTKDKSKLLDGIKKDFTTLDTFTDIITHQIDYKIGLYILFNFDFFEIIKSDKRTYGHIKSIILSNNRIILWNIPKPIYEDGILKDECIQKYSNSELKKKILGL